MSVAESVLLNLNAYGHPRLEIAQRVADAHAALDDRSLVSFVSGSTVEGIADALSDVDMSVVFESLPSEEILRAACNTVGSDWTWTIGDLAQGSGVVSFRVDGVEVQIGYATHAGLAAELDELLVAHNPDTPNHKLAEGILKAMPLVGRAQLAALQARLTDFPHGLRLAMVRHGLATPTPWRAATQLIQRDASLWCREIEVDACYGLLRALCGLNRQYFTRFQLKRMDRLCGKLQLAPPKFATRIDALLGAPPSKAFEWLYELEGEVLDLVAQHLPEVDLVTIQKRRTAFVSS